MEVVVKCTKCDKKYKLESSKIPDKGAKITCPNCGNVFVVRRETEEAKEDFIPCSICGLPASVGLDTDKPLCERCKTVEDEKAVRFMHIQDDGSGMGSPMDRELDLKSASDVSFGSLSEGDYSHDAYSTEMLPDKGKAYVPPGRIHPGLQGEEGAPKSEKAPAGGQPPVSKPVDFFEGTQAPKPTPKTEPAGKQPKPPTPSQPPVSEAPQKTPSKTEVKPTPKPSLSEPTPPPKPSFAERTPPPKQVAAKPAASPAKESPLFPEPTPPPKPAKNGKVKSPTVKEPPSSPVKSDALPEKGIEDSDAIDTKAKKSSPVPLIIAVVLLAILVVYVLKIFR